MEAGLPHLPRCSHAQGGLAACLLQAQTVAVQARDLVRTAFSLASAASSCSCRRASMLTRSPPTAPGVHCSPLTLSGIGRPDRVMPDAIDRGLGLFDGLNAIPKRSTLAQ